MRRAALAGRRPQVAGRRSNAGARVVRPASGAAASDAVALDLAVPETLLAKLALSSPSRDPAAAAVSFLLDRFKQPL